ncbi:MAG: hypothetical protein AB9897_07775 [Anaerolineaceae bacterium]
MTNIVPPFYTNNEVDYERFPCWHDNELCAEGKKILPRDKNLGVKGNKCENCIRLDAEGIKFRILNRRKFK